MIGYNIQKWACKNISYPDRLVFSMVDTLFFYKGWTKISSTHHPLVLPNFYTLVSLIFFRQDTHPILFPYRYIYSGPYMKAHPLYLEKFEYSPSLIFPKFSVLIISSLIKASLIKKISVHYDNSAQLRRGEFLIL